MGTGQQRNKNERRTGVTQSYRKWERINIWARPIHRFGRYRPITVIWLSTYTLSMMANLKKYGFNMGSVKVHNLYNNVHVLHIIFTNILLVWKMRWEFFVYLICVYELCSHVLVCQLWQHSSDSLCLFDQSLPVYRPLLDPTTLTSSPRLFTSGVLSL